jgi:hypothetical protein
VIQQHSLIEERDVRISFLPKSPESRRETERPIVARVINDETVKKVDEEDKSEVGGLWSCV